MKKSIKSLRTGLNQDPIGLQHVFTARILSLVRKYDHITPVLISLHWLSIPLRIDYKVTMLTFKCMYGLDAQYLSDIMFWYNPARELRSSSQFLLKPVKATRSAYGERAFATNAPKLWNSLPYDLRSENDFLCFKSKLKTYMFTLFVSDPSLFMF